METKLVAERRVASGTSVNRRLRAKGLIPGNVYGHKQDAVAVLFAEKPVMALVKTTHRVVEIELDGKTETTLLREVQWNTFHSQVQHLDFMRVDPNERVKVDVDVVLKGTSPGALQGGLLEHPLHALHVDCLAIKIPDVILVKVHSLQIGQAIHVRELELPEGVTVLNNPDAIVVRVIQPVVIDEPVLAESTAEPEVIKKEKKAADEDEKSGKK